eukprot:SAG31_NODE_8993_length_1351_cov_1.322684_3_plen_100_part_00
MDWEGSNGVPIYSLSVMEQYSGRPLGATPPHIFAVADHAYRGLLHEHKSQSILISGESGAGKTEATKRVLDYITCVLSFRSTLLTVSSAVFPVPVRQAW